MIRRLLHILTEDDDVTPTRFFAAFVVLIAIAIAVILTLVTLMAWRWWIGLPFIIYLLYRLARHALSQDLEKL